MQRNKYTMLCDRGVIEIRGKDKKSFLQGLITNNIEKTSTTHVIYAALLTPQGKYLFDFFVSEASDSLFIDCQRESVERLIRKLSLYKLRADVELIDRSDDFEVVVIFGDKPAILFGITEDRGAAKIEGDNTFYVDPRLPSIGIRILCSSGSSKALLETYQIEKTEWSDFDTLRITLGIPDGDRDLVSDKSILLENGFEELNGIDWEKGCYMGQELTARTKYRGLIKKRLVPVLIEGFAPPNGAIIKHQEKKVGEMRSSSNGIGLALIRLDHITLTPLKVGDTILTPQKPAWANF